MIPLSLQHAPQTPPRQANQPTLAKPSLVPLSLGSSSPIPTQPRQASSEGAPLKHAHFEQVDVAEPESPSSEWRKMTRKERDRVSRSEGSGEESQAQAVTAADQGTFPIFFPDCRAVSDASAVFVRAGSLDSQWQERHLQQGRFFRQGISGWARTAASYEHGRTPVLRYLRSVSLKLTISSLARPSQLGFLQPNASRNSSYVPSHQRTRSRSGSWGPRIKPVNPLSAFDRSACPEEEDSFYTNCSSLSIGTSPSSSAYTTPSTSRYFAFPALAKPSPVASPPTSPVALISRGPYLDPTRFKHPIAIEEEDEIDALSATEEAALAGDEDEASNVKASKKSIGFVPPPGVKEENEDVCFGCGAEKNLAFISLVPCRHTLCHVCVNALINGAAHKPPRPSDCFACSMHAESFVPTHAGFAEKNGGIGLVLALKQVLELEQTTMPSNSRRVSLPAEPVSAEEAEGIRLSRSRRRRSSVVAAAIAATILVSAESGPSRSRSSTFGTAGSSADSRPSSPETAANFGAASNPLDSGTASPTNRKSAAVPDLFGYSQRGLGSGSEAEDHPAPSKNRKQSLAAVAAAEPSIPPAIDWPVVRLDNLPWEVTADEVEKWVGEANLASDLDEDMLKSRKEDEGGLAKAKRVTLAVHILCNRADGRTLNQAYLECSSRSAARTIVRLKDGSKLRNRPVHVSLSSQGEFLTTLFPTYSPGFTTLEPNPNPRSKWAVPIPLLLQTELTGLLNLCRLESAHAKKVCERPYFNIVTLLEKMPWSYPSSYNSQAIVRLFNTACAAIEILGSIKHQVREWRDILTVMVDAILHCSVFRPQQKQKASFNSSSVKSSSFELNSFTPSSLKESFVGTAPDKAFLAAKQAKGGLVDDAQLVELGLPSPRFGLQDAPQSTAEERGKPATVPGGNTVVSRHHRRRSSVAAQLNIDKALVESVAAALGISLEASASSSQ
ncbi:hypothetical protein JCM11641_007005 [Rhodosporidiobolus odoratus]